MGHTFGEMGGRSKEEQESLNWQIKLRKDLQNVSLAAFTVADLEAIQRIQNLKGTAEDIEQIELKLIRWVEAGH